MRYYFLMPDFALANVTFSVRAKKQLPASSLCHSLVPHTIGELQLRFSEGGMD